MNTIETNFKIETYEDAIEFLLQDISVYNFEVRKKLIAEFQHNRWHKKLPLIEALEATLNVKIIFVDTRLSAEFYFDCVKSLTL